MSFTPGPWRVREWPHEWIVEQDYPAHSEVALLAKGGTDDPWPSEANARLIAQSPLLLSSAKHAMKVIERTVSMNEEYLRPVDANALLGVVDDLDELITRVEGRS